MIVRKILGTILICLAIGVALHQIIVYEGWEWDEMLKFPHHESTALVALVVGLLIWATVLKRK